MAIQSDESSSRVVSFNDNVFSINRLTHYISILFENIIMILQIACNIRCGNKCLQLEQREVVQRTILLMLNDNLYAFRCIRARAVALKQRDVSLKRLALQIDHHFEEDLVCVL